LPEISNSPVAFGCREQRRHNKAAACHAHARSADVTTFINWHWRKETTSYHTLNDSTNLDPNFARNQPARAERGEAHDAPAAIDIL
jgi:hypothetical protein